MLPVLQKLQDYVLFFHHNLNARAIATLEDTYKGFDGEFNALTNELVGAQREIATFETFQGPPVKPRRPSAGRRTAPGPCCPSRRVPHQVVTQTR
jgi:hypothetical protein